MRRSKHRKGCKREKGRGKGTWDGFRGYLERDGVVLSVPVYAFPGICGVGDLDLEGAVCFCHDFLVVEGEDSGCVTWD
jgi:hypothetical protein